MLSRVIISRSRYSVIVSVKSLLTLKYSTKMRFQLCAFNILNYKLIFKSRFSYSVDDNEDLRISKKEILEHTHLYT